MSTTPCTIRYLPTYIRKREIASPSRLSLHICLRPCLRMPGYATHEPGPELCARARSFSLAARAARRTFSQRSSSSLSFVTRTSCTGCVSPTSRRAIAIAELLSCSTLTSARAGEHSAVCGVSARCSQKRTAPRGSKPACASSLVVGGEGRSVGQLVYDYVAAGILRNR